MALRKIAPDEFARRLKTTAQEPDKRFAFFLGAGCSVSSGIPAARTLVSDDWLPRLRDLCAPNRKDTDKWAKEEFPDYKRQDPAAHYGAVMEKLFLDDESRQREIERLCDGKFPGFGYAVLAGLMAQASGCFSAVVTTNFDDLIPDALYLFTESRPLVIHHESLAGYIRSTRTRPLVVKLHGDHRLSPHSTAEETARLAVAIENQVRSLLHDRGLIFIGYGGRDEGILRMLDALPTNALPLGVYWVSAKEPRTTIAGWLEKREAVWVEKQDFDELMLLVKDACALPHPDEKRLEKVFRGYMETYASLSGRIASLPDTAPEAPALKAAARRIDESITDWWSVELAARRVKESDPAEAERIYEEGLERFPSSSGLLGWYAIFLKNVRKDYDRAEELYKRAIDADPHDAADLGNYAVFLDKARKDYERAEEMYRRAIDAEPQRANTLGNYAGFLLSRGRREEGLALLERAIEMPEMAERADLPAECWFYAFAHRPPEQQPDALGNLKRVVVAGGRSRWWDFSQNIERARQDGHPDVEWLESLVKVIAEGADISILDGWDKWRDA